jgi:cell wall-associated NlpC family hydrolase
MIGSQTLVDSIITEARTWKGTIWHHNQRCKGAGVDCAQFIGAVASAVGIDLGDLPRRYSRQANDDTLLREVEKRATKIEEIEPGAILVFKYAGFPHHLAIATSPTTMIHSSLSHGKVVEHSIEPSHLRILIGVYRCN